MLREKKGKNFYFHMNIYADSDTLSMVQHKVDSIFFWNSFFWPLGTVGSLEGSTREWGVKLYPTVHSTPPGILKEQEWEAARSRTTTVMDWETVETEASGSDRHSEV